MALFLPSLRLNYSLIEDSPAQTTFEFDSKNFICQSKWKDHRWAFQRLNDIPHSVIPALICLLLLFMFMPEYTY